MSLTTYATAMGFRVEYSYYCITISDYNVVCIMYQEKEMDHRQFYVILALTWPVLLSKTIKIFIGSTRLSIIINKYWNLYVSTNDASL